METKTVNTYIELLDFLIESYHTPSTAKIGEKITFGFWNDGYVLKLSDELNELIDNGTVEIDELENECDEGYFYWETDDIESYDHVFNDDYELRIFYGNWSNNTNSHDYVEPYSFEDYFNTNGFKFTCTPIKKGTIDVSGYIDWYIDDESLENEFRTHFNLAEDNYSDIKINRSIVVTADIIATASSKVTKGKSSTGNLQYTEGHNKNDFIPGHRYTINGEYFENDHYKKALGIGTLEISKISTTTTIETNNTEVTIGDNVTLTIKVKENKDNTLLNRGTITVYDGTEIVQSNHTVTGTSTSISFIPNRVGNHTLKAVYTDSGVEYNSSVSEEINITVNKLDSQIILYGYDEDNGVEGYYDDTVTIECQVCELYGEYTIGGQNVYLYYNNTLLQTLTSDNNGEFTLNLTLDNWNYHKHSLNFVYNGDDTHNGAEQSLPVTMKRHTTNFYNVNDIEGYTDDTVELTFDLRDEDSNPVDGGVVEVTLEKILPQLVFDNILSLTMTSATKYIDTVSGESEYEIQLTVTDNEVETRIPQISVDGENNIIIQADNDDRIEFSEIGDTDVSVNVNVITLYGDESNLGQLFQDGNVLLLTYVYVNNILDSDGELMMKYTEELL